MNHSKQRLALIAVLLAGVLVGYLVGVFSSAQDRGIPPLTGTTDKADGENGRSTGAQKPQKPAPISQVGDKVVKFVNTNLLKPGVVAEMSESYETDYFYAFNLKFLVNGQPVGNDTVYTTKDGKYLILNLFEIPEEITETKSKETTTDIIRDIDTKNEPFMGYEDAKITIIEFSGYSCPFCAKFAKEILPKIMSNFSVKLVFKDFPVHGEVAAHEAANCALEQGKYWEYHDMLFERQKEWMNNASKLYDYARILGLDVEEFNACVSSGKYRDEVLADKEEGVKLGVTGTPTFFINGRKVVGALPYEEFERILKEI